MKRLFTAESAAHLRRIVRLRPLLAFDFDGTLAPIVAHPTDARIPEATLRRLVELAALAPVAVITGRSVADVRGRLGFEPWQVVGSHGAEDPADPISAAYAAALDPVRAHLHDVSAALSAAGVIVEDKGASIALHYRLAADRDAAERAIRAALIGLRQTVDAQAGKLVFNLTAGRADDKAAALRKLVRRAGAGSAVFVGDDTNDEPVFAAREPEWFTVRVGRDVEGSRAQYVLESLRLMPRFLEDLLAELRDSRR